tara:strand:+ start:270 stop:554 length:285 start_codon:yes stop_codon:yes gene_type:complete
MSDEEEKQQLLVMMTEMVTKMQVLLEKQDELADNITKIKEAVYHPDQGLYARLSSLGGRLDLLETWKNSNSKILWVAATVITGLALSTAWQAIF